MIAKGKLAAVTGVRKYLDTYKTRILFKVFFKSQFKDCPLTWMFCNATVNNRNNQLHKRALRLVYNDYDLSIDELLEKGGSFTVHDCNIQTLAVEMFKVYNNQLQTIFSDLFIRQANACHFFRNNAVWKGSNSISYFGPIIWDVVLSELKLQAHWKISRV